METGKKELVQVRLYATLRQIAGTREVEIPVEGQQAVGDVLRAVVERYPRLSEAIWNADGSLAGHVAVVLNGRDVRHLDGVDTPISDDDRLDVFPPVGGGDGRDIGDVTTLANPEIVEGVRKMVQGS